MTKRKSIGYSKNKETPNQAKLLYDLQKSLIDLNSPQLLIHNIYGGLTKFSIYS